MYRYLYVNNILMAVIFPPSRPCYRLENCKVLEFAVDFSFFRFDLCNNNNVCQIALVLGFRKTPMSSSGLL